MTQAERERERERERTYLLCKPKPIARLKVSAVMDGGRPLHTYIYIHIYTYIYIARMCDKLLHQMKHVH